MITTEHQDLAKARDYFTAKVEFSTGPIEVNHMIEEKENIVIVDVRAGEDYAKGHVPGAINLPREAWRDAEGLSKDAMNIIYCYSQTCHLAAKAALEFSCLGYPVMEMDGGFEAWTKNGLVTQR
jgi:rhodanese-related sulfurtransferase